MRLAMERLLLLPSDLLRHELFPFFNISDVVALDVAVSHRRLRPLLLEVYRELPLAHRKEGLTLAQMVWFFTRSIPLQSISFDPPGTLRGV